MEHGSGLARKKLSDHPGEGIAELVEDTVVTRTVAKAHHLFNYVSRQPC